MFEKLKELYYKGEEKWYAFWDKVNEHLPVYTIIDKVDAIVPSFVLFLILILFLLLFIGFFFFAQTTTEYNAELTFVEPNGRTKVIDSVVTLKITQNDNTIIPDTNYRTDSDGKVILDKLKYGQVVEINVNLSKGTYNGTLLIDQAKKTQTIVLEKKIDFSSTKRTITVKDSFGMTIFQPIAIDFWCENRAVRPTPESGITSSGVIEVTEPYDCVKLNAMPNSSNYEKKTYTINSNFYDMTLLPYEAPKTELKVKVRNNGNLVSETNFTITVSGSSIYTGKTLSSSEAIISVIPGTYTITASDPSGKYATKTQTNVNVETKKEITLEVTKEIRARINIKTIDLTTKSIIKEAIVSLKNPKGNLLAEQKTDNFGTTIFPITDIESYQITAKKPGDLNGGYYAKTIDLNSISSDTNIILELEKITISNAGKTKVRVVDQDLKPVSNAKIILKYKEDDSIVELNQSNNWAMTDVNGYVTFLAGKVEGLVYAYALKYPFSGASEPKLISIDKENEFLININIGEATIKIDLKDEAGQKIDGTARILLTSDNSDLSGLMSIEQGTVQRKIKAGQQVYLAIQSDTFENYITEPRMLFPDKTYTFTVTMKKQINEPKITLDKVYNENDIITRTLQAGKKYYAKLIIESDEKYPEVVTHFRVGKEKLLENDFIEIDKVEGAGIYRETRGTSFDPERGYDYDGENLTDGYAKWINTEFKDFEKGIRVIKIWFNVKRTAPANKELQFFYKAKFGDKKDPPTTNIDNELYDDAKPSNIYYVGEEATCEEAFCITSESLYWIKEDLYINAPYEVKQAEKYNYKYQLMNNSGTDYGTSVKNMTLILTLLNGDKEPIRVMDYQIKDGTQEKGGSNLTNPSSTNLGSFNKDTAVDLGFIIEGNEVGASAIKLELKVDGVIIYTRESTFSVPSEKELQVKINPSFVPSLANTELVVEVSDDKGEPVNKADVKIYAKEMGIDEYLIDSSETNRVGKTVVNSGAHYQKTRLILEVTKEGFARKRLTTVISEEIVAFNPESTAIALNTISKREDSKKITIGNQTTHELKIVGIKYDTKFNDIINEQAMKAHSDLLIGTIIPAEEMIELELLKVRLVNSITQNNFIEPITLKGDVIITFQIPSAGTVYDKKLELTINVSSEANADASCLIINNATQTKTTQLGQVTFSFELLNACSADERDIDIDSIYATFSGELKGSAQLSLTSPTSGNSGRSALDGAKRKIYDKVLGGEKLIGTVTYTPSEEAIGSTETLTITLDGKFQGRDIKTSPGALNFSVNVLNLQECMTISSDSSPIAIDETAAITIDASNCLGQTIEVALCRNDAGCSGGKDVEGKITLSKRNLTLKSTSETINAYSPTIPGSYGVTVYARVKGKSSYVYIGETPVTFKEDEDKYFKLSKYDLMIVGDGSEDIILLTNEMLTQDVRVKANECLWGKEDADWGATEYLTVLSTAVIGASLGKTIGENFNKDRTSTVKSDGTTEAERETMTQRANEQMSTLGDGDSGYFYENPDTGDIMMTTQPVNDPSYDFRARVDVTETELGTTYHYSGLGTNQSFSNSNAASAHAVNEISSSSGLHTMVWAWGNNAPTAQTNSIPPVIRDKDGAVASSIIWEASRSTQESEVQLPVFKKVHSKGEEKIYDNLLWFSNLSVGFLLPTYLSEINDFTNGMDFGYDTSNYLVKKSYSSASFMPEGYSSPGTTTTTGSIKWGSGIGSVVGAIIGAYIGYLAAEDSLYRCAENFQIGEFSDFVIFLQGDTMSVATPDGESTEERTIPSDAGALNFTLSGVSTAWDFSDADYGEEENVGIRFTNAGLNDAQPKYGTLTINATKHIHGSLPDADGDTSTGSGSDTDFDVFCHDGNFGNYWIGANAGEGSCTGVTATEYSQKYHIRVISGESNDSSAYLSKESSCNNGILVGSTGPDTLPKIKLNWDWDAIKEDTCSYENEDYVYCDATQTTISLVKKLADLEDFLKLNQATGCPNDSIYAQTVVVNNEINSYIDTVAEGYIGPEEISISVIDDVMTAKIKVNNKTGGAVESFYSYTIKGSGEPVVPEYPTEKTFPAGISEETITANISKYEGVYFFTVVFNGNKGNRRALTRAFENREAITDSCWIERTTRSVGGLPAISYYLNDSDQINWTSEITNISDLFDHINFGSYLIRDSYNEDFIIDFRNYYITNFGEKMTETERKILDYLASGKVKFSKRFSGDTDFEAGLYDVWFYIDFTGETLSIIDSNADIEISLLSIRNPIETYPFYYIPFDGLVGEETIRNGYGATYKNLTEGKNNELKITTKDVLNTVSTFENVSGNGVVTVNTKKGGNLVSTNSTVGTRGQLASISYSDYEATFTFTPNYATPIIMKKTLNGTTGLASFKVLKDEQEVNVGGNFSYWTGAAKSKDFYGSAAIDVYEDSPDYELEQGGYGFEWIDASFNGNLYLKTIIYTPTGESYVIESDDSTTKFWTPNGEFTDSQELIGISGMNNNNQLNLSTFESLQDLLDLVKEKKVCISNDGSNMTFWWNQKTISTTAGTQSSLEDYELSLIGK